MSAATTSTRALLVACEQLGVAPGELLAAAGLTAPEVEDPDGQLSGTCIAALWRIALERTREPSLGLRAAVAVPFGAYSLIDFLAASAPTVGEGLRRVARYFPLINPSVELRVHDAGAELAVELAYGDDPAALPRSPAEYSLGVTFLHCQRASGFDWPLARVGFAFAAPADSAEHERVFGCPVRFGQPRTELVIARDTWELPSHNASLALLRTLEEHADRLLATLPATRVEATVARVLTEELRGGDPSLATVARRLAMSERTLQRRLGEEGASFAAILDSTRRHFAACYLDEPRLAVTEIAYLLGFSEPSAFTRAFQRWYGTSPTRYRAAR